MEINTDSNYISSLPLVTKDHNGKTKHFRIDTNANIAYEVNKNGSWTGNYISIVVKEEHEDTDVSSDGISIPENEFDYFPDSETAPAAEPVAGESPETDSSVFETLSPAPANDKRARNLLITAAAVCVALIWLAVAVFAKITQLRSAQEEQALQQSQGQTSATQEATSTTCTVPASSTLTEQSEETESVITQPTETMVEVLVSKQHLMPGDILSEQYFDTVLIEESTYLEVTDQYWLAQDSAHLTGMTAAAFVAQGDYISKSSAQTSYCMDNPWYTSERATITFPVDYSVVRQFPIGSSMSVSVVVDDTIHYTQRDFQTEYTGDGITGSAEEVNRRLFVSLELSDVVVVDWLNEDQESLFPIYSSYAQVPAQYLDTVISTRYNKTLQFWDELPCYVTISLNDEQYQLLSSLADKRTVTPGSPSPLMDTKAQQDLYEGLSQLYPVLYSRWNAKLGG